MGQKGLNVVTLGGGAGSLTADQWDCTCARNLGLDGVGVCGENGIGQFGDDDPDAGGGGGALRKGAFIPQRINRRQDAVARLG